MNATFGIFRAMVLTAVSAVAIASAPFASDLGTAWTSAAFATQSAALTRAQSLMPDQIEQYFNLVVYVDKSEGRENSQRMWVFQRRTDGTFDVMAVWNVSTGLGRHDTPAGIFTFAKDRLYRNWRSRQFDVDLPWASFLDALIRGVPTGVAVHGTTDLDRLGTRASHGCIRLDPEHARQLQQAIRASGLGDIPELAYDRAARRTNEGGNPETNSDGQIVTKIGYRAVLIIDQGTSTPLVS